MPEPVRIAGGAIAGLVAADAIARGGRDVVLTLGPDGKVGGGFLPMRRDGLRLELGVRLLELGYEDDGTPPPLSGYDPGFGGHRPYTPLVAAYVEELAGDALVDVPAPLMVLDGRLHDDVFFTVDLSALKAALGPERAARVHDEALLLSARSPSGVLAGNLDDLTLEEASLANHGRTLHATLIAPPAEKFFAGGAARVLAAWRRKVWMPLFWPQTVAQACNGAGPAYRPVRRFASVAGRGPGAVVEALMERLRAHPRVTIETGAPDLRADVLALSPRELLPGYAPERVRSVIAWVEVAEDDLACAGRLVHVVDPANPVARVSDSGPGSEPGRHVLCVELRHDTDAEQIDAAAVRGLREARLLRDGAPVRHVFRGAMPTFDAPTRETRDAFAAARAALDVPGVVVGGAAAPGADAFNEQVVAGLAAAERFL